MNECKCRPVPGTRYYDTSKCPTHKRRGQFITRKVMK